LRSGEAQTGHCGSADQWACVSEPGWDDTGRTGELESAPEGHFILGGPEERFTKSECDRSGHECKLEIEQAGYGRHGSPDQRATPTPHRLVCFGRRPTGNGGDRRARCFCLEAPPPAARTGAPVGLNDDVTDVTCVPT
jgi:hypothetical protein